MKKSFIIIGLLCLLSILTFAQTDNTAEETAVKAVIQQLFDGMRKGDANMVKATFHESARLQTVGLDKSGKMAVETEDIAGFVEAVGKPHPVMWDERILSYEIRIDDRLATAWTPYEFYAGDKFSHAGIDAFQLCKTDEGWKIMQISDTRRRTPWKK